MGSRLGSPLRRCPSACAASASRSLRTSRPSSRLLGSALSRSPNWPAEIGPRKREGLRESFQEWRQMLMCRSRAPGCSRTATRPSTATIIWRRRLPDRLSRRRRGSALGRLAQGQPDLSEGRSQISSSPSGPAENRSALQQRDGAWVCPRVVRRRLETLPPRPSLGFIRHTATQPASMQGSGPFASQHTTPLVSDEKRARQPA